MNFDKPELSFQQSPSFLFLSYFLPCGKTVSEVYPIHYIECLKELLLFKSLEAEDISSRHAVLSCTFKICHGVD